MTGGASRRYLVSGRVQGVGFRAATCEVAGRLGLDGWVRNLPDGRVEALASGAPTDLDAFEAWLWRGPPHARVSGIESATVPGRAAGAGFAIR